MVFAEDRVAELHYIINLHNRADFINRIISGSPILAQ